MQAESSEDVGQGAISLHAVPKEESNNDNFFKCFACSGLVQTGSNFCNFCGQKRRNEIIPKLTLEVGFAFVHRALPAILYYASARAFALECTA